MALNSPVPYLHKGPIPSWCPWGELGGCVLNLALRNTTKETCTEKQNWKVHGCTPGCIFTPRRKAVKVLYSPASHVLPRDGGWDEGFCWIKINIFLPLDVVTVGWGFGLWTKYRLCETRAPVSAGERETQCMCKASTQGKSPLNQGDALGGRWVAVPLMKCNPGTQSIMGPGRKAASGCLITHHKERVLLDHPVRGAFYAELNRKKVEEYLHTFSTGGSNFSWGL